jgi:hypothetical protein
MDGRPVLSGVTSCGEAIGILREITAMLRQTFGKTAVDLISLEAITIIAAVHRVTRSWLMGGHLLR